VKINDTVPCATTKSPARIAAVKARAGEEFVAGTYRLASSHHSSDYQSPHFALYPARDFEGRGERQE